MYDVTFFTNLDCPKGHWSFPPKVLDIPRIGDKVESLNGPYLKVCSVIHSWKQEFRGSESKPILKIELTSERG